ncbi:MAG: hypothetical protein NT030_05495 [Candidatus Saganbacteria bacterium]|nr:hypothetical protein [Candidatus Saganbacteria bacterium]
MSLSIIPGQYKAYVRELNKSDLNSDGTVSGDNEVITAATNICEAKKCGQTFSKSDVATAEAYLRQILGISEKKSASGTNLSGVKADWGKGALKSKIEDNGLIIEGSLSDAEHFTLSFQPLTCKKGQYLTIDVEADGAFIWGRKNFAPDGWQTADGQEYETLSAGKSTIKYQCIRDKEVSTFAFKTGGMADGYLKLFNIRIEN